MTKSKKKLVVVDADTLVFRSAAVSEERKVNVKHLPSGRERIYKNRTEFKSAMKEKNFEIKPEDFEYEDIQEEQPIEYCLHTIKMQTDAILERFKDSYVVFVAGDSNNFRLDLQLPKRYKSNRDSMLRPVHLAKAKEYFIDKYKAVSADGYEADDLTMILAYEGLKAGKDSYLLSPDKDAQQAIGLKLWDYTKPDSEVITIKEWHPAQLNDKKEFKSYGIPWICFQWINGDLSDGFSAKALAGKKIGDVGFYDMFKDCKSPRDNLQIVVNWFKESFGESFNYTDWQGNLVETDWKGVMNLYYKCCKMKSYENDSLDCFELLNRYGVSV